MSFQREWEERFKNGEQASKWPWSDLVTLVMRYCRPFAENCAILELGIGTGANIPFFLSLPVTYFGIDGSAESIRMNRERFPKVAANLSAGDFTTELPANGPFHVIIDRASLTCNSETSIRSCIRQVKQKLAPGGIFVGVDWYSTENTYYTQGSQPGPDQFTRTKFATGPFQNLGTIHFSDAENIKDLFSDFELLHLEHKMNKSFIPIDESFAAWNFVARLR